MQNETNSFDLLVWIDFISKLFLLFFRGQPFVWHAESIQRVAHFMRVAKLLERL